MPEARIRRARVPLAVVAIVTAVLAIGATAAALAARVELYALFMTDPGSDQRAIDAHQSRVDVLISFTWVLSSANGPLIAAFAASATVLLVVLAWLHDRRPEAANPGD